METSTDEVTLQRDRDDLCSAKNLRESIQALSACQPEKHAPGVEKRLQEALQFRDQAA
jgi:hypothetical protein